MFTQVLIAAKDTNYKAADVQNPNKDFYAASIYVTGTDFDGGTVALYSSIHNGATLGALKDDTGTAVTTTANAVFFVTLGGGYSSNIGQGFVGEQIWAKITGSGGSLSGVYVSVNSNA